MNARNLGCLMIAIALMTTAKSLQAQCSGGGGGGRGGASTTGTTGTTTGTTGSLASLGLPYASSAMPNVAMEMIYAQKMGAMRDQAWLRESQYKQQLARRMRNESLKSDSNESLSSSKNRLFAQKTKNSKSSGSSASEKFASK